MGMYDKSMTHINAHQRTSMAEKALNNQIDSIFCRMDVNQPLSAATLLVLT